MVGNTDHTMLTLPEHVTSDSASLQALTALGLPEASTALHSVSTAFERMSLFKEFRTPQPIRALLRPYITIILPIYVLPHFCCHIIVCVLT
jgi:hypothetical protein